MPVAYGDAGRRIEITASARFAEINRARLIAVSDIFAQAVVALLVDLGVDVVVDHVRVDPVAGDEQDAVVSIRPGAPQLRVYSAVADILLDGQSLAAVIVPGTAQAARRVGARVRGRRRAPRTPRRLTEASRSRSKVVSCSGAGDHFPPRTALLCSLRYPPVRGPVTRTGGRVLAWAYPSSRRDHCSHGLATARQSR